MRTGFHLLQHSCASRIRQPTAGRPHVPASRIPAPKDKAPAVLRRPLSFPTDRRSSPTSSPLHLIRRSRRCGLDPASFPKNHSLTAAFSRGTAAAAIHSLARISGAACRAQDLVLHLKLPPVGRFRLDLGARLDPPSVLEKVAG
jgi:hypothetical protein